MSNKINADTILDGLLVKCESEIVEFKKAKKNFDFDDLGKYLSALSNEANLRNENFAWIVFGVNDKTKDIEGTSYKDSPESLNKLKQDIAQQTTDNHTFFEIYQLNRNGKRILLFQIPPAPKGHPIAWKGVRYGRNGESLTTLSDIKMDTIRNQRIIEDWSSLIINDATIDDLDENAILKARELYANKHEQLRSEMQSWDNIKFLNKAKITRKGKITNAAIVLLGKAESEVLISPAVAKIRWVLKDRAGNERDFVVESCPLLMAIEKIYGKIRNLKYRYINPDLQSLFPEELDTYDPYVIREAINNAIAHQDYNLGGMINVVEYEDQLVFSNLGAFIPSSIQLVLDNDAPEESYRNKFLAQAMVELKMVDTIGSGIRRMFSSQRKRLFPMPDYDLSRNRVLVTIVGKILDHNYSVLLSTYQNLSLSEIEMLNRVQFNKKLTDIEIKHLRQKKLIEGRKPNLFLAKSVAQATDKKGEYTKNKGLDDCFYKELIINALKQHHSLGRKEIDNLLIGKLSDVLTTTQQVSKITNLLTSLRKSGDIRIDTGKKWVLNKS